MGCCDDSASDPASQWGELLDPTAPGFNPCPCCRKGMLPERIWAYVVLPGGVAGQQGRREVKVYLPLVRLTGPDGRYYWEGTSGVLPGTQRRLALRVYSVYLWETDFEDVPPVLRHAPGNARWVHAFALEEDLAVGAWVNRVLNEAPTHEGLSYKDDCDNLGWRIGFTGLLTPFYDGAYEIEVFRDPADVPAAARKI